MPRGTETVLLNIGDKVVELLDEEGDYANKTRNSNSQEAETNFAHVKAIYRRVYERKDFEEGVVDAISK